MRNAPAVLFVALLCAIWLDAVLCTVPSVIGTDVCVTTPLYNEISEIIFSPAQQNQRRFGYIQNAIRGRVLATVDSNQVITGASPPTVYVYLKDTGTGLWGPTFVQAVVGSNEDDDDQFRGVDLSDRWMVAYTRFNVFFFSYSSVLGVGSMYGSITQVLPRVGDLYTWAQTYCNKAFFTRGTTQDIIHYQLDPNTNVWAVSATQPTLIPGERMIINERHRELVILGTFSGGSQSIHIYRIVDCCDDLVFQQSFSVSVECRDIEVDPNGNIVLGIPDSGLVVLFARSMLGTYSPTPTQFIPGPFGFGSCVAHTKDDGVLLIGSDAEPVPGQNWRGRAYTFRATAGPGTYTQSAVYNSPNRDRGNLGFGEHCTSDRSIDAHDDVALMTHPRYRGGGLTGGAVFMFYLVEPGTVGVNHRCSLNSDMCTADVFQCPSGTCVASGSTLLPADDDDNAYDACSVEVCDARVGVQSDRSVLDSVPCATVGPAPGCMGECACGVCGGVLTCPSASSTSTPTPSPTPSPSSTTSASSTNTASGTVSTTPSATRTSTPSPSTTASLSRTPSSTTSLSNTPSSSQTPSNTPSPSQTSSNTPSPSQTPSNTPTPSSTPSGTPSKSPSTSESVSSTPTSSESLTSTPTSSESLSATRSVTSTASTTAAPSQSRTSSESMTSTPTPSESLSSTASLSGTPSMTAAPSATMTASETVSSTPTSSESLTSTPTSSASNSASMSSGASASITPSQTPTVSDTGTASPTRTISQSRTATPTSSESESTTRSTSSTSSQTSTTSASMTTSESRSSTPSASESFSSTRTTTPTPSTTSTSSESRTGSETRTSTPTTSESLSSTRSESATQTITPTASESSTAPATVTSTPTASETRSTTRSASSSTTVSATQTPTPSTTTSASNTATSSESLSATPTSSETRSTTPTASASTPLCVTDADCPSSGNFCQEAVCLGPSLGCGVNNITREGNSCVPDVEDVCQLSPQCVLGECLYTETVVCIAQSPCHHGYCESADGAGCTQITSTADGLDCDPSECSILPACYGSGDGTCGNGKCLIKPAAQPQSCDDSIGCTADLCLGALGCVNTPDSGRCAMLHIDQGDDCTSYVCDPTDITSDPLTGCVSTTIPDGVECVHQTTCPNLSVCQSGTCQPVNPTMDGTCEHIDTCNPRVCDPASLSADPTTGCVDVLAADGTSCTESDTACRTGGGQCLVGACEPTGATVEKVCNSGNDCIIDTCNPILGCMTFDAPPATICDFDTSYGCHTGVGVCDGQECVGSPGDEINCSDGIDCTVDSCVPGANNTVACSNRRDHGFCAAIAAPSCQQMQCVGSTYGTTGCEAVPFFEGDGCIDTRPDSCSGPGVCTSGCCVAPPDHSLCPYDSLRTCAVPTCSAGYNSCDISPPASVCSLDLLSRVGDHCIKNTGPLEHCMHRPLCTAAGTCEFSEVVTDTDCAKALPVHCVNAECDPEVGCVYNILPPGASCNSVFYPNDTTVAACAPAGQCTGGVMCDFSDTPPTACPLPPSECEVVSCTDAGECAYDLDHNSCDILHGTPTPPECKAWECQAGVGCVQINIHEGEACVDGGDCTVSDHCVSGECIGNASNELCDRSDLCDPQVCEITYITGVGTTSVCATNVAERTNALGVYCGTENDLCNLNPRCDGMGACIPTTVITDADCDTIIQVSGGGPLHSDCSANVCIGPVGCVTQPSNTYNSCDSGAPTPGNLCYASDACTVAGFCEPDITDPTDACVDDYSCTFNTCRSVEGYCTTVPLHRECALIAHTCATGLCTATGPPGSGCSISAAGMFETWACDPRQAGADGGTCVGYLCEPNIADHLCPPPENQCQASLSLATNRAAEVTALLLTYDGVNDLDNVPYLGANVTCTIVGHPDGSGCTKDITGCSLPLPGTCVSGQCVLLPFDVSQCTIDAEGPPGPPGEDGVGLPGPPGAVGSPGGDYVVYVDDDDDDDNVCDLPMCLEYWGSSIPAFAVIAIISVAGIAALAALLTRQQQLQRRLSAIATGNGAQTMSAGRARNMYSGL